MVPWGILLRCVSVKLGCQNVNHDVRRGPQLSSKNDLLFASVFKALFIHVTTAGGGISIRMTSLEGGSRLDRPFEGGFEAA